jgi:hypothetical protein
MLGFFLLKIYLSPQKNASAILKIEAQASPIKSS